MSGSAAESKVRATESGTSKVLVEKGPTKEVLVRELQEILGLPNVHFEKLSRAELLSLTQAIMNVSTLLQTGGRVLRNKLQDEIIPEMFAGNRPFQRILANNRREPFISKLQKLLSGA